jgi:hypothetical protein
LVEWVELDRPWVRTEIPCNDLDRQLFRMSTVVNIYNTKYVCYENIFHNESNKTC